MKRVFIVLSCLLAPLPALSQGGVEDWNLNFGLGVEQYRDAFVEQASIKGEDRIVVVEKTYKTRPSGWLTVNWNILGAGSSVVKTDEKGNVVKDDKGNTVVLRNTMFGLFAGTKIIGSDSSAFDAFSFGPQVTFALQDREISIGAGWVTHKTKRLGRDIVEGSPLPAQYDDVSYKEGTENSYMMMLSISVLR